MILKGAEVTLPYLTLPYLTLFPPAAISFSHVRITEVLMSTLCCRKSWNQPINCNDIGFAGHSSQARAQTIYYLLYIFELEMGVFLVLRYEKTPMTTSIQWFWHLLRYGMGQSCCLNIVQIICFRDDDVAKTSISRRVNMRRSRPPRVI